MHYYNIFEDNTWLISVHKFSIFYPKIWKTLETSFTLNIIKTGLSNCFFTP